MKPDDVILEITLHLQRNGTLAYKARFTESVAAPKIVVQGTLAAAAHLYARDFEEIKESENGTR